MSRISIPQHFELDFEPYDEGVIVRLAGEFDIACEAYFEAALRPFEEQRHGIVIDLSALRFIDSSGLRLLIDAHERSHRDGYPLKIVLGDGPVRETFELTGLNHILPVTAVPATPPRGRAVGLYA